MTALPQSNPTAPPLGARVSHRLLEPLGMVAGRVRVLAFLQACLQLMVFAGTVWLAIAWTLGTFRDLPNAIVITLAIIAWAAVVFGIARFFRRGVLTPRNLASAARLADAALPGSHERISSAVELSQESDPRFRGSPELIACLIRQAEKDADNLDPNAAASGTAVLHWAGALAPLLVLWLILLLVKTPDMLLGLRRTFNPWTNVAALPTVLLDVDPGDLTAAQGETVTLNVTVSPAPGALPTDTSKAPPRPTLVRHFIAGSNPDLSTDMEPTGTNTFHAIIDNVEQSFSYRINAQGVQSPAYTVTVLARPAVTGIEVSYQYPAYTGKPAHTEKSPDGAIDALVGTQVTLTVESAAAMKSAQLLFEDNAPNPAALDLLPVAAPSSAAAGSSRYSAQFTLLKSTQYHIHLVNARDIANADRQGRPITARIDMPPQISILSPRGTLTVRPADDVPIQYAATDDFLVTRIDALVQVDDKPPLTLSVPLDPAQKWSLSLPEILRQFPGIDARRITYQLRATDNRAPVPQSALSQQQTLEIDKNIAPLAQRQDSEAVRDLAQAVRKAQTDLTEARQKLDAAEQAAAGKPLDEPAQHQVADARNQISQARHDLSTAAGKAADSRLADSAQEAQRIADDPMRQAQEAVAGAALAADQPEVRGQSAAAAQKDLEQSQRQLGALAQRLDHTAQDQPLAQQAERLQAEQEQLAAALEKNPTDPALLKQQRDLQAKTEQMIKDHPELQKPASSASQVAQDDLVRRIQELEREQKPLDDTVRNQADAADNRRQLRDPKAQADLNRQVDQLRNQAADSLKQSGAKLPDQSRLDQIAKDLAANKPENAGQSQQGAAMQMDDAAAKLQSQADRAAAPPNPKAAEDAAQAQRDAAAFKDKSNQLGDQIDQANKNKTPPVHPSDPANQQAAKLADDLKRAAQQMAQKPGEKPAADQMAKAADAARKDAAKGDAAGARQELAQGADRQSAAASEMADAATPHPDNAKALSDAAAQARDLAARQHELADQTAQRSRAIEEASQAKTHSDETAKQQQAMADKLDQAAKDAQSLADQTKGKAPEASNRAGQAAQSLHEAAQQQRDAGQASREGDAAAGAPGQQKSSDQLASAEESMTGQPSAARGNNTQEGRTPGKTSKGSSPPAGSQQATGPAPPGGAQQPGGSTPKGGAQQPPGASQGGTPPGGVASGGTQQPGGGDRAAQSIQAARDAQARAANGDPGAAREAARDLDQAAHQLAARNTAPPSSAQPSPGQASPGQAATGQSSSGPPAGPGGGPQPGGTAGPTASGSSGAPGTPGTPGPPGHGGAGGGITEANHPPSAPPLPPAKEIQELGISPSDWARFPPAMQDQLLHSAQQSEPAAYRDMIKNYYSRIARLQEQGNAP